MSKKSTKENKNIYFQSRTEREFTRLEASLATGMSESRIEKIEYGQSDPYPEEVLWMAKSYKKPELNNHYCTHVCPIGKEYVPEVQAREFPTIVLQILSNLNNIEIHKNRLIDIAADGHISEDEYRDFVKIKKALAQVSITIDELDLWIEKALANNELNKSYWNK